MAGLVLLAVSFGVGLVESVETFSDSWLLAAWPVRSSERGRGAAAVTGFLAARHGESLVERGRGRGVGVLMTLVVLNEVAQGL